MTTGELLIALFQAYKDKNDDAFMKAAITLIDEEKAKNHYVLANNLKKYFHLRQHQVLDGGGFTNNIHRTFDLPRDKDNGGYLVEVKYPHRTFDDVVLSDNVQKQLENIILEYKKKSILHAYGFVPKTKILLWSSWVRKNYYCRNIGQCS